MTRILFIFLMLLASAGTAAAQGKPSTQSGPIKVTGDTFVIDDKTRGLKDVMAKVLA